MKRALQLKTLLVLLILPLFLSASNEVKDKHSKTKTIKKEFSVNSTATLKVNNSYGNLDVVTWNENRIVFEITITTSGNDEEKVEEKLKDIDVVFSATTDLVSAETKFNKNNSKSWWKWNNKNNVNMKINYVVKMPITGKVNLNNDYGNINLEKLEGKAEINCDYGKITTKELMADGNVLNFDYTKGCYFEYIKSGKINADYSDYTVSKTKNLDINADYTNSKIEVAEDVNYNCDYGNIKIDKVNNITGNGDYLTTIIGDVYKNVSIKADYGSIKINRMTENAGNVSIKSDYTGIKIGYAPQYNFSFEINLQYASLNSGNDLEFSKKTEKSFDKYYSGHYGSNSTGNKINISSEYGSLTLFKN
ncbi:DUF4097 domain-containing protein [Sabulilitoribacter multivorans]|uniref:DUF4097 domain-containing protein n=1 Tax=Flaviramulus multivorans TaxID=1304750 RepID=A0ABS9IJV9_9FLAO|nr:DUF4097 domain-containing protein [Flaviramulus multivorans]MCF7560870.1 DUF4097 domain-containing protein [Flaviramulus multivorans]